MAVLAPPVQVVASGAPPFVQVPSGAPPFVVTTGPAPPIMIVASGAPPITLFNADGSIWSAHTPAGGEVLLTGETDGFATDFLHPVDAERVALKTSGSTLAYAVDAFYTQSGTSPKMVYDVAGVLGWSPHNLQAFSTDLAGALWTKIDVTFDNVAQKLTEGSANGLHLLYNGGSSSTIISGVVYTQTIEVKSAGRTWVWVEMNISTSYGLSVNLATGAAGGTQGTFTQSITALADGWYRISMTATADAAGGGFAVSPALASVSARPSYQGDGTSGVLLRNPQLNRGSVATAHLPTTTATRVGLALDYDPVTHAAKGLLCEPQGTNSCLWNRDLTNAAWTKSNVTAAKDQTGVDGVASAASKITATAANGTCLQAITLASSARYQTAFVKRITGSGVINMTMDNGTTWTAIAVTSSWQRFEIPTQTLANPTVGFRIVTSGDAVAIDLVQNES
jgi:hypothetical protein